MEFAEKVGAVGESCTDRKQAWNKGTTTNIGPKRLCDVVFNRHTSGSDTTATSSPTPLLPTAKYDSQINFHLALSLTPFARVQGSMLNKAFVATPFPVPTVLEQNDDHETHSVENNCNKCHRFFDRYICVDPDNLERATRGQSDSGVWFDSRRIRVTASTAKKIPVRSNNYTYFLKEKLYPKFRGNTATQHGMAMEKKALDKLSLSLGYKIEKAGTRISQTNPWLSASPDGVCPDGTLIEVKCPLRDVHSELEAGKTVCDVHLVGGKPVLKKKGPRGYYLQVQLSMYCHGADSCIFFVFCQDSEVQLQVPYDAPFVNKELDRLKEFYFVNMLPRIVDDFQDSRLTMCRQYIELCGK